MTSPLSPRYLTLTVTALLYNRTITNYAITSDGNVSFAVLPVRPDCPCYPPQRVDARRERVRGGSDVDELGAGGDRQPIRVQHHPVGTRVVAVGVRVVADDAVADGGAVDAKLMTATYHSERSHRTH